VIDRSKTGDTPKMPVTVEGRRFVRDSGRGNHLGQRSCANATKGRTYDASDLIKILPKSTCEERKSMAGWSICGAPSTPKARSSTCWSRLGGTNRRRLN